MNSTGVGLARAALAGNPSDGYFGKTVAFAFEDFTARVWIGPADHLEIRGGRLDSDSFDSLADLVESVDAFGYYGGIRLLKAAARVFATHFGGECDLSAGMTISYESDIPYKLGLGGSSAIVIACLRALSLHFGVDIAPHHLANIALEVERDELGIPAGLQDRVVQSYDGLIYMDFDKKLMDARGWGEYAPIDPALLPPVYVAYMPRAAEGSEIAHADLRSRFELGDPAVLAAIDEWKAIADQVRLQIEEGAGSEIGPLLDRNLDVRHELGLAGAGTLAMADAARAVGASANSTGSGGAIVGAYEDGGMLGALTESLGRLGAAVISPRVSPPSATGDSGHN